jgi:hypothetical protein
MLAYAESTVHKTARTVRVVRRATGRQSQRGAMPRMGRPSFALATSARPVLNRLDAAQSSQPAAHPKTRPTDLSAFRALHRSRSLQSNPPRRLKSRSRQVHGHHFRVSGFSFGHHSSIPIAAVCHLAHWFERTTAGPPRRRPRASGAAPLQRRPAAVGREDGAVDVGDGGSGGHGRCLTA